MPGVGSVCQTRSPKNGSSQSRGPGRAEIHGFLYEDGFLSAKFSVVGFGQWLVLASGRFWPVVGFSRCRLQAANATGGIFLRWGGHLSIYCFFRFLSTFRLTVPFPELGLGCGGNPSPIRWYPHPYPCVI